MTTSLIVGLCAASAALTAVGVCYAAGHPKYDGASDVEVREFQTVGKAIVSPEGKFLLYEWVKPYSWTRDTNGLPKLAANRMQAIVFKVNIDYSPSESQYLFYPKSAASFWLGSLSPDGQKVCFYQLDNDSNRVKLGVYDVAVGTLMEPKLTWFEEGPAPDAARLDQAPAWVSNDELIYPGAGKAKLVRADLKTGRAAACSDCAAAFEKGVSALNSQLVAYVTPTIGPGTRLLASSPNGDLAVYAKEDSEVLSVLIKKGPAKPVTLFESRRQGPYELPMEAAAAAGTRADK
jgi:hypothetical protein